MNNIKSEILASVLESLRDGFARLAGGQGSFDLAELLSNATSKRTDGAPKAAPVPTQTRRNRAYTTARNRQINIKASQETLARFYAQVDARGLKVAEAFELAVKALEGAKK